MQPKTMLAMMGGFLVGVVVTTALSLADFPPGPFAIAGAFAIGFATCFFIILIFSYVALEEAKPKPAKKDDEWWQRGDPPPWDDYKGD